MRNKQTKKVAIATLGCRLNQFESNSIATDFKQAGYEVVRISERADVYIINTCTVTNKSDAKSRNMIRKAHKQNPASLLVVIGCYAETDKEEIEKIKGVDLVIGNKQKSKVFNRIHSILNNGVANNIDGKLKDIAQTIDAEFDYTTAIKGKHTRSFIKIQDGCNQRCTYCKIPSARGEPRSKGFNDTIEEVQTLYSAGYKEFILTGINIVYYNDKGKTIEDLIKAVYKLNGDFRLRLSSAEPDRISYDLLSLFTDERMGHHLHIPLQSGSDRILKLMGRHYDSQFYIDLVDRIRDKLPNINITTDLIIGFPTETEADFEKNVYMVKRCNFTHVHTFKYSKRRGTPASQMPNQVSEGVKSHWSEQIRTISAQQNFQYREKQSGKVFRVLVEQFNKDKTNAFGFTENYVKVEIPECINLKRGEFAKIEIINVYDNKTIAKLI